jgi:hypothetical protein
VTRSIQVGPINQIAWYIVRVDPVTGKRSLLSDFTNPAQGVTGLAPSWGAAIETPGQILVDSNKMESGGRDLLLRIDPNTGNRVVLSDVNNAAQGPLGAYLGGIAVEKSRAKEIIVGNALPS